MQIITIPRNIIDPSYRILTWVEIAATIGIRDSQIANINKELKTIEDAYVRRVLEDHRHELCLERNKLLAMMEV